MSDEVAAAGGIAGLPASAGRKWPSPPAVLVLASATSGQFGGSLAATLFHAAGPAATTMLRLVAASAVLLIVFPPRLGPLAHDRRRLGMAVLFGLALAGMNLSFYEALDRMPLGAAVGIEFIGPLAVAVIGSRRPLDLLWAALAVAGVLALTGAVHHMTFVGLVLIFTAAGCWALYIVLNARMGRLFDRTEGLALGMTVAALVSLPLGILAGGGRLLDGSLLAKGAGVGVLSSVIPYSLDTAALRQISAGTFGVLMSVQPAMGTLAGYVVLGQNLGLRGLAGIALVTCASVGATTTAAARRHA